MFIAYSCQMPARASTTPFKKILSWNDSHAQKCKISSFSQSCLCCASLVPKDTLGLKPIFARGSCTFRVCAQWLHGKIDQPRQSGGSHLLHSQNQTSWRSRSQSKSDFGIAKHWTCREAGKYLEKHFLLKPSARCKNNPTLSMYSN